MFPDTKLPCNPPRDQLARLHSNVCRWHSLLWNLAGLLKQTSNARPQMHHLKLLRGRKEHNEVKGYHVMGPSEVDFTQSHLREFPKRQIERHMRTFCRKRKMWRMSSDIRKSIPCGRNLAWRSFVLFPTFKTPHEDEQTSLPQSLGPRRVPSFIAQHC